MHDLGLRGKIINYTYSSLFDELEHKWEVRDISVMQLERTVVRAYSIQKLLDLFYEFETCTVFTDYTVNIVSYVWLFEK